MVLRGETELTDGYFHRYLLNLFIDAIRGRGPDRYCTTVQYFQWCPVLRELEQRYGLGHA